jgi:general secretion pathway protein K
MVDDPRRGMILLTVLWAIALLATLAMAAAVSFRGFAGVASVGRDRVQGDALLTAGLEMAAGAVSGLGDEPLTEREIAIDLSTGTVRARFSDEGGRIDIGKAPSAVLAALLRFAGAPEQQAQAEAQEIVRWRRNAIQAAAAASQAAATTGQPGATAGQPGATAGQPGATAADPPDDPAGKPEKGQPFADVREVLQVPGMTPQWLAAITPLTTVFGSDTVNPLTAPAAVIAALPGVNRVQLESFLAVRRSFPTDAERLTATLGQASPYLAVKSQRVASVELTAALLDGYPAAAHAVIVLLPQDSQPYRVLVWKPLPSSVLG